MINPNFYTQVLNLSETEGTFVIDPLPAGFGHSLGNALRRTLLSSIKGAALTQIKINNVNHLFSTIKGIKESVLELSLNLKQLRFRYQGDGPFKIEIEAKGMKKIFGKDVTGEVEVINKDQYIGELTDNKAKLEIEGIVETGIGYQTAEERKEREFGYIALDAYFSPIKKVNFKVETARVGGKSDCQRLIIEIATDGSIKPDEALRQACQLLANYFLRVLSGEDKPPVKEEKSIDEVKRQEMDNRFSEIIIDELNMPSRIINALLREKIETVADLIKVGRSKLTTMKGVGKKSIELIEEELKKMGIDLK